MKKFEKAKKWVKEHGNMIVGIGLGLGTVTCAYLLGGKICELQVSAGIQKLVEEDGVLTLTKPHKKGEPLIEIEIDEWIKMMQERNGK